MNELWKVRKEIMNKTREDYDIIDENQVCIKDPEKAKTHIAITLQSSPLLTIRQEK